jgi:hypothetical protein
VRFNQLLYNQLPLLECWVMLDSIAGGCFCGDIGAWEAMPWMAWLPRCVMVWLTSRDDVSAGNGVEWGDAEDNVDRDGGLADGAVLGVHSSFRLWVEAKLQIIMEHSHFR